MPAVDATTVLTGSGASVSASHTPVGTPTFVLVLFSKLGPDTTASVTYGGQACLLVGEAINGNARMEIWKKVNPLSGTQTATATRTGGSNYFVKGAVVTFTDAGDADGFQGVANGASSATAQQLTVASAVGRLVIDLVFALDEEAQDRDMTPGASQTELGEFYDGTESNWALSTKAGGASVTMDYTFSDNMSSIGHAAVSVSPPVVGNPWYYYAQQ